MRIVPRDPPDLDEASTALLDPVTRQTGFLPDLMRLFAHSPASLGGYLALRAALQQGELPAPLREQIAVAVAATNGCTACLTNHVRFGREAGLSEEALQDATRAHADDPAAKVALTFSRALIEGRGHVDDAVLDALRGTGFGEGAIIEIVAVVALNVFANFVSALSATTCAIPASGHAVSAHR